MGVATEPKAYTHALSGGRPGATVRVRPLLTGEINAPPAFFRRPDGPLAIPRGLLAPRRLWSPVPIPAFLVDHPGAGPLLIDTGLHASVASAPAASLGTLAARMYDIRMEASQSVPAQLEGLGVEPRSVRAVVMTHLHYDHASGVSAFPEATFVVARAEWDAAASGRMLQGYRPRQFDHAFDWRAIDYASTSLDSFAGFGRSVDLLGDGSIRLVFTPGHSAGHQSVVLRLHDRELLLTGDAAYRRTAIEEGELPLFCADEHLYRRSLSEIRAYVERTPNAVVICGHDPQGWAELDAVYS
ncbi:N-acyl homoserine lactonase family protein [Capillimicrobium parvum]|uniref:N-acyl homoserine lactonase family protein n=1 Tax=Capillimicrobium parvum TaxID=2884022 RepID=UPI00216AEDD5|nr:N-acyl homoserine lactonase family protein [Capillimicrobium parvum]